MNHYLSYIRLPSLSSNPSVLFALLALVILILYSLSLGRSRALLSLLAIYIAFVFEMIFPYYSKLVRFEFIPQSESLIKVIIFLFAYVIAFIILNRSLIKSRMTLDETSILWVLIISALQLILLISIITNISPLIKPYRLPPLIVPYVSTPQALFFWSLVPLVLLIFLKRRKERRPKASSLA